MKYYLTVTLLLCSIATHAQNIYGEVKYKPTDAANHFKQFSVHHQVDTTLADGLYIGDFNQTTTDLKNTYYRIGRRVTGMQPPFTMFYDHQLGIFNVANKTTTVDPYISDTTLSFPEYHNDTLWCLYKRGFAFYDLKTGTDHIYDTILKSNDIPHDFHYYARKSAFDHKTMTYMFSKVSKNWADKDTFCMYNIRTRQFVKKVVPDGFIAFDYLPANNKVYYILNSAQQAPMNPDSIGGVYEYDPQTGRLGLHQKRDSVNITLNMATMDPVKGRLYFVVERTAANGSEYGTIMTYRVNAKTYDVWPFSQYTDLFGIEFLPTYADTSIDRFTTVIDPGSLPQLKLYPNPAQHTLQVQGDLSRIESLSVLNMAGQVVATLTEFDRRAGNVSIDIRHLASGKYVLSVESPAGRRGRVFVVEQ